jgi:starch phosphorylase
LTLPQTYRAAAASVRERMTERWDETYAHFTAENPKMIYYLSMEFLQARGDARASRGRVRR